MTYDLLKLSRRKIIIWHALVWLLFISYEVAYIRFTVGIQASIFHFAVYYLLNIGLFYFNAHIVLDFAVFRTRHPIIISIILIIVEVICYLLIKYILDYLLSVPPRSISGQIENVRQYLLANIWRGIYFLGFSIAYWSMLYMLKYKEKNHAMETEQLRHITENLALENKYISAENAFLQNQISPHLLFNSLNFIYNTVYSISEKAGNGVILLADLMRYSLTSSTDGKTVSLLKEAEQVENLIRLNQLRFDGQLYLKFKKKGNLKEVFIIPLILITLVENMMKHGDLGEARQPACIELEMSAGRLTFRTKNKTRTFSPYPPGGLGVKNIEKRLNNFYHDRYS